MPSIDTGEIASALASAVDALDLDRFSRLLATVPDNRIASLGKEGQFHEALRSLARLATQGSEPIDRLNALALLGKAESTVQRREKAVENAVRAALRKEPPRLVLNGASALDFNARRYIAEMLDRAEGDWVAAYAAQALLDEDRSDHARLSFAQVVCDRADTLEAAFELITAIAPKSLHAAPGKKDSALARARRIARLLPAISEAVRQATTETGDELDARIQPLFQALVFRFDRPTIGLEGEQAGGAAVAASLTFLATLVRTRFSISGSAETYSPVSSLRRWWKGSTWPEEAAEAVGRLERSVIEAITLQARIGRPPRELLSVWLTLSGDRRSVESRLKKIAEVPGLDEDVRAWLLAGGSSPAPRFTSDHAIESGLRDADQLIAAAAIRAERSRRRLEQVNAETLPAVRSRPDLVGEAVKLTQFVNDVRALLDDLASVFRRRSLDLFGVAGELVPSDPTRHETRDGRLIDTATVKVQTPGVVRRLATGNEAVVTKAIVEMVEK